MEDSPNDRMVYRTAMGHRDKDGHLSRVDLTDLTVTLPSIEERVELNNSGILLRIKGMQELKCLCYCYYSLNLKCCCCCG